MSQHLLHVASCLWRPLTIVSVPSEQSTRPQSHFIKDKLLLVNEVCCACWEWAHYVSCLRLQSKSAYSSVRGYDHSTCDPNRVATGTLWISGLGGVGKGHMAMSLYKLKAFVTCTLIELGTRPPPVLLYPFPWTTDQQSTVQTKSGEITHTATTCIPCTRMWHAKSDNSFSVSKCIPKLYSCGSHLLYNKTHYTRTHWLTYILHQCPHNILIGWEIVTLL